MNVFSISNIYQYNKQKQYENNNNNTSRKLEASSKLNSQKNCKPSFASDGHVSTELYTEFVQGLGYNDYHVFDGSPITVYHRKFGAIQNDHQLMAKFYLSNRQEQNNNINEVLDRNGIQLSDNDKLTLTVDKECKISVSGTVGEEKRAKIEQALNSKDAKIGANLFTDIMVVNNLNGKLNRLEYDKWEASRLLEEQTGQSLKDLKLVDGKIIGANEKLESILNSSLENVETGAAHLQRVMLKKLKTVLSYGADNIPDLKFSIDYQNGSLIDKDVKYGFGPEQLKTWFDDVMACRKGIDY